MNIVEALHAEESRLQRQLVAVQGAISALNGEAKSVVTTGHVGSTNGVSAKRTMSAAVRAKIGRSAKLRWVKIRAEKSKGKTTK